MHSILFYSIKLLFFILVAVILFGQGNGIEWMQTCIRARIIAFKSGCIPFLLINYWFRRAVKLPGKHKSSLKVENRVRVPFIQKVGGRSVSSKTRPQESLPTMSRIGLPLPQSLLPCIVFNLSSYIVTHYFHYPELKPPSPTLVVVARYLFTGMAGHRPQSRGLYSLPAVVS